MYIFVGVNNGKVEAILAWLNAINDCIDLLELANTIDRNYTETALQRLNEAHNLNLTLYQWNDFIEEMKYMNKGQMELFA